MKHLSYALSALSCAALLSACATGGQSTNGDPLAVKTRHEQPVIGHPDATPFIAQANAKADVALALDRARKTEKFGLIVMGANWCDDSRALAGHFQTARFQSLIADEFELVYVDLGQKDKNLDIPTSFGVEDLTGIPIVVVTSSSGKALNLDDASRWRNAATRSGDDIFAYFVEYTGES